ncbi:MAG: TonB-dependent receptor [Dysgonamonadaceae bacterium]|jgi:iron complex outermembrane receptor protein|nr:TonB-dependent receptor [Dysgonamonadaceae bacterium]
MTKKQFQSKQAYRFRRFIRKRFAVFNSLHRQVTIGVVTGAILTFAAVTESSAQTNVISVHDSLPERTLDEVLITSSKAELTFGQMAKIVSVITRDDIERQPVQSVQDLLKNSAGIDIRQRGANGVLAGISVRGGTFEQTAVLLNGANLTNPQTGHYTLDIPVNLSDIKRIEIIEGPTSLLYGAGALSGGINIVTKKDAQTDATVALEGGMQNLFNVNARTAFSFTPSSSHSLSASYSSSDGYIANSDYEIINALLQNNFRLDDARLDFQFGINDKKYGANTFYSASYPNQYDDTRSFFGAIRGETAGKLKFSPQLYWNRHYDIFHLFRPGTADIPAWYTSPNYHRTDVLGLNLNSQYRWAAGITGFGGEIRNEGIVSSNLGIDSIFDGGQYKFTANRTNISAFIEHSYISDLFTVSTGLLINHNTAFRRDNCLFPSINTAFRPIGNVKIFASWNRAVRMPTFTDLYYTGATHEGNSDVRPERSESLDLGAKYENEFINMSFTVYYMKGTRLIDWVKQKPDDKWQSCNLTDLDKRGIEANASLRLGKIVPFFGATRFNIGYAFMNQDKDAGDWISNYVLDYLRHKAIIGLSHPIYKGLSANWQFRWQDRVGSYTRYEALKPAYEDEYKPFSLLDAKLNWKFDRFDVYLLANNLFDVAYYDLGNIPQPLFWLMWGVAIQGF